MVVVAFVMLGGHALSWCTGESHVHGFVLQAGVPLAGLDQLSPGVITRVRALGNAIRKSLCSIGVVETGPMTRFVASLETPRGLTRKWVEELSPGSAKASPSRDP